MRLLCRLTPVHAVRDCADFCAIGRGAPGFDLEKGVGSLGLHHALVAELIADHLERPAVLLMVSPSRAMSRSRRISSGRSAFASEAFSVMMRSRP